MERLKGAIGQFSSRRALQLVREHDLEVRRLALQYTAELRQRAADFYRNGWAAARRTVEDQKRAATELLALAAVQNPVRAAELRSAFESAGAAESSAQNDLQLSQLDPGTLAMEPAPELRQTARASALQKWRRSCVGIPGPRRQRPVVDHYSQELDSLQEQLNSMCGSVRSVSSSRVGLSVSKARE